MLTADNVLVTEEHSSVNKVGTDFKKGFPGSSAGKESACNAEDPGLIPGLGRFPGGGHGNPLQYSCLENPPEQRSLVGYNPWGSQRDMTEQLSMAHLGAGSWKRD